MLVVIEVPHQKDPSVYIVDDSSEFIKLANKREFSYSKQDIDSAKECYGDEDGFPEALKLTLSSGQSEFIEIFDGRETQFFTIEDAPSETEAAIDFIRHDLKDFVVYTLSDAQEFISGRKEPKIPISAVNRIRSEIKELCEMEEDTELQIKYTLKYAIEKNASRSEVSSATGLSITTINDALGSRFSSTSINKLVWMAKAVDLDVKFEVALSE